MTKSFKLKNGNTVHMSWHDSSLIGNCGAGILHDILCTMYADTASWSKPIGATLDDFFNALDETGWFDNPTHSLSYGGFYILTDNVAQSSKVSKGPDSPMLRFGVAEFVEYLIARKKGVVIRGVTTENRNNHPGASVITSWSWCPYPDRLLSAECRSYGFDGTYTTTYQKLVKVAEDSLEAEANFAIAHAAAMQDAVEKVDADNHANASKPKKLRANVKRAA